MGFYPITPFNAQTVRHAIMAHFVRFQKTIPFRISPEKGVGGGGGRGLLHVHLVQSMSNVKRSEMFGFRTLRPVDLLFAGLSFTLMTNFGNHHDIKNDKYFNVWNFSAEVRNA